METLAQQSLKGGEWLIKESDPSHTFIPEDFTEEEKMIRDQFHHRAMSGGILLDQGIHMLDVCNWGLRTRPVKAIGSGGLKLSEHYGDAWNHYQVVYEYPDGVHVSCHSTQFGNVFGDGLDRCGFFVGGKRLCKAE